MVNRDSKACAEAINPVRCGKMRQMHLKWRQNRSKEFVQKQNSGQGPARFAV